MVPIMFVYLFLIADVSLPSHPGLSNLPWGYLYLLWRFFWRRFIGHGYIRSDPDTEALSRTVFLELSKVILKLLFEAVFCFQDIAEW